MQSGAAINNGVCFDILKLSNVCSCLVDLLQDNIMVLININTKEGLENDKYL